MTTVKSTTKEKIGYAFGNMGSYILWTFVATYVTVYATDCLGLPDVLLAALGTVILVCRFFDGFSDILLGMGIENTHSRLGKARPWFGVSILPLSAVFVAMFLVSIFPSNTTAVVVLSVLYFIFTVVLYTMNNLGFNAMLPRISNDSLDQTRISVLNSVFTFVGGLVTAVAIPILNAVGGIEKQLSWTVFVIILAVFAIVTECVCFFTVKEKPEIAPVSVTKRDKNEVKKSLIAVLKTKYFYIAAAMFLINYYLSLSVTASGKYYAQYVLGDVNIFSLFGSVPGVTMAIGLVLTPLAVKKIGRKKSMMIAVSFVALGNLLGSVSPYSFVMGFVGVMVKGFGSASVMCQLFTLQTDIVKLIDLKKGLRVEGIAVAANSFGCKIGSGLGSAVVLWALAACGYVSGAETQSAAVNTTFITLYWWIPTALSLVLLLLASFWNIEKDIQAATVANAEKSEQEGE